MPDNIKKVVLQKKIENTLYQIFPKTDATITAYSKTVDNKTVVTTVAAELAALSTAISQGDAANSLEVANLRDLINGLGENESLVESFDTLKEIGDFLDQHEDSIGALAALITDVGVASQEASGDDPAVTATGIHADVEELQTQVAALIAAAGTNVSKTHGVDTAANGSVYLDGVETVIYDDSALDAKVGASTDTADADGTSAWARIKAIQNDLGVASDSSANPAVVATGLHADVEANAADIDALESGLGASTDTASASGTTAWSRIKEAEGDIDDLEAGLGASTNSASSSGTTAWSRILNAENDIDALETSVGSSGDAASASGSLWARVKNLQGAEDQVQYVTNAGMPTASNASEHVLYLQDLEVVQNSEP